MCTSTLPLGVFVVLMKTRFDGPLSPVLTSCQTPSDSCAKFETPSNVLTYGMVVSPF